MATSHPKTTTTSAAAWSPDVVGIAPENAIPDALILQTATRAGFVEGDEPSVRVPWADDAVAGFVAEGTVIDEADTSLSEAVVFTGKIAQLLRVSREQFVTGNAASLLSTSVARAVTTAANIAYLTQAAPSPGNSPPAGLASIVGIETAGPVATDLDELIKLVAVLETNGATPSHIVMAPDAWGWIRRLKAGTASNESLLGAGTNDVERMLLDLPVLVTPAAATGTGMVLSQADIIAAVGNVQVATSDDVYFASDSVAVRCTWRFGQTVKHANRIGSFTVTDPDA